MKEKRGFVIAETIIVGVFVMSMITFIYMNMKPLIGMYESQEKYHEITTMYYTDEIRNMIMYEFKQDINNVMLTSFRNNRVRLYSGSIYKPDNFCLQYFIKDKDYCNAILNNPSEEYKIKYLYFIPYNICYLKKILMEDKYSNSSNLTVSEYFANAKRKQINLPRELTEYILYTKTNYEQELSNCKVDTNVDETNRLNKYFRMIVLYENGNIGEVEYKIYE